MSDIYTQTLDALTAPDQTFAFKEELHSSGVTYREFTIHYQLKVVVFWSQYKFSSQYRVLNN